MRKLYTKDKAERSRWRLLAGIAIMATTGWLMVRYAPDNRWLEIMIVTLIWAGIAFVGEWFTEEKKWGRIIATGIVGLLVLQRVGLLSWGSTGLLLVGLGLISLIN